SVEEKFALERQNRREQAAIPAAAVSSVPQHTPTRAVVVAPPPKPEAVRDDIPAVTASEPITQTGGPIHAIELTADTPQVVPISAVQQPEPESQARPEIAPEPSIPETSAPKTSAPEISASEPLVEPIAESVAHAGGSIPIEPAAASGGGDAERTIATQWTVWI